MTTEPYLAQPAPAPRGRGAITTGVVLLLVGVLAVVVGAVGTAVTASRLLGGVAGAQTAPATFTKNLDAGTTYAVYEATTSGSGTDTDPFVGDVHASDVTITGPGGGAVIPQETGRLTQTVDNGSTTFVAAVTFDPLESGIYTITVDTPGVLVAVGPAITSLSQTFVWIGLIGLGVLLGLVGLVLLIIGLVRRSSARKEAAQAATGYAASGHPAQQLAQPGTQAYAVPADQPYAPAAEQPFAHPSEAPAQQAYAPPAAQPTTLPPAAWYPDPERPGGQRYWDGRAWTEHRA